VLKIGEGGGGEGEGGKFFMVGCVGNELTDCLENWVLKIGKIGFYLAL
jgi:hypothetical protein